MIAPNAKKRQASGTRMDNADFASVIFPCADLPLFDFWFFYAFSLSNIGAGSKGLVRLLRLLNHNPTLIVKHVISSQQ